MVARKITPPLIITWSIVSIVCIFTLLGNGFIIVVNGYQWLQKRKMVPSDFLLTCLSSSRIFPLSIHVLGCFLQIATPETYQDSYTEEVLGISFLFFDSNSLWCATWLSVLYCVKVTNFVSPFFLWLKSRINVLVPRLLGVSVVLSMVLSVPSFVRYYEYKMWCNLTGSLPGNTSERQVCNQFLTFFMPLRFSLISINFFLTTVTSTLLLTSLWRHVTNLRKSGADIKVASTQVHINVMKPKVFYLLGYISYFTGMIAYSAVDHRSDFLEQAIWDILICLFPLTHTITLILTNPRLKKASANLLNIR